MGIENLEDALDGPGNPAIYHALAAVEHSSEDMIRQATERISRLIERPCQRKLLFDHYVVFS